MERNKIYQGEALEILKTFPNDSIDCVITSPPYWNLRDYGVDNQLGLEKSYKDYINRLCDIFDEVKRVLKPTGTCWVNLGDTYSGSGNGQWDDINSKNKNYINQDQRKDKYGQAKAGVTDIKNKSLVQIPNRFSIEMVDRGWVLRNEIIWHKPNAMPSSAKDRFTVDFEKIFFFTKETKDYYFEQILEPYTKPLDRWGGDVLEPNEGASTWDEGTGQNAYRKRNFRPNPNGRNKRTVWSINTQSLANKHYASYPESLIEIPIDSGCPEGGLVLDPFMGSGTTGLVALKKDRDYIGIELNPNYIEIANNRLQDYLKTRGSSLF